MTEPVIETMGDAVQHLIQDSGELYATGEYEGMTEKERIQFAHLLHLSNAKGFVMWFNVAAEKFKERTPAGKKKS